MKNRINFLFDFGENRNNYNHNYDYNNCKICDIHIQIRKICAFMCVCGQLFYFVQ